MRPVFDRDGLVVAWLGADGSLYDPVGIPVAYLDRERLYSYEGMFLGWYVDGWFRDRAGSAAGFIDGSSGGPSRPAIQEHRPHAPATFVRPVKIAREKAPSRRVTLAAWVPWSAIFS